VSQRTQIGRYEVLGQLATGGMAEILLGCISGPSGFRRPVVVKRILPHLAKVPEFRNMFLDEARIIARIHHENVVQVHELGSEGDALFLVMEYLDGESVGGLLRRLALRNERLPYWLAAHVIAEACAGLHSAHELTNESGVLLGLVHRDVSPQNVFVTYEGSVKLLDFGIAKVADKSSRTATGHVKGKFQYMSPEQCRGEPLDRRSDVFALGAVLYELTTNTKAFKRATEHLTFLAICEEPIVLPSRVVENYPRSLEPVVMRALSKDPKKRYPTALEMRQALVAALREIEPTGDARQSLAELMRREFAERIREKRELVRLLGSGETLSRIPEAEVDELVELPGVTEMVSAAHTVQTVRRPSRSWVWMVAIVVLIASGVTLTLVLRAPTTPVVAADLPPAASPVPAVSASVTPGPSPSVAASVPAPAPPRVTPRGNPRVAPKASAKATSAPAVEEVPKW
jgi:eukaryotic-like serine/threonine-protein kinase